MRSYAAVDRMEGKFAICELELEEVEASRPEDYFTKETKMVDIPLEAIPDEISEGDILIVEHDKESVTQIFGKDDEEKQRRVQLLEQLMV